MTSRDLDAGHSVFAARGWTPKLHPSSALLKPVTGDTVLVVFDADGDAWCVAWEPDEWPADPGL